MLFVTFATVKELYIKFTNQPKMSTIAFSIIIPTWNNLPFLKICIASIIKNSIASHQIIVHINDGSDGTLEWIKEQGIDYTYSKENIGVCMSWNQYEFLIFIPIAYYDILRSRSCDIKIHIMISPIAIYKFNQASGIIQNPQITL